MAVTLLPQLSLDLLPAEDDAATSSSLALASDLLSEVLGVMSKHEEEAAAARAAKLRRLQDERFAKESKRREKYEKNKKRQSMVVSGSPKAASPAAAAAAASPTARKSMDLQPITAHTVRPPFPLAKSKFNRNSFVDVRHSTPIDVRRASVDARRPLVEVHRPSLDIRRPSLDVRRPSLEARRISYFSSPQHSPPPSSRRDSVFAMPPSPRHVADVAGYHFPAASPYSPMTPSFSSPANQHRSIHRASMSFPPPGYSSPLNHSSVPEEEDEDDDVPLALLPAAHGRVRSFASLAPSPTPRPTSVVLPTDPRRHSTALDYRRQSSSFPAFHSFPHAMPHTPPVPYPAEPLICFSAQEITSSRVLREFARNASSPSLPLSPGRHRKTASAEGSLAGERTLADDAAPAPAASQTSTSSEDSGKTSAATRFLTRATGKKSKRATMLF
ncbi:hypothetical protein HDU87_004801 [Geranomyces variabilis]|uniref:Uncharacterized protein n=1 Tax=Geranomyces variabilis TaxID=109894 RepID=A0AAD5THT9_9FUNG|nr:hypothetical protein HDU87_004801 [Geranomyces variabilis]